jgi:hypothetical protein
MSPGSKDPKSNDQDSTKSQADSPTSGKMTDDEFLKLLTETQWPADFSEEEETEEEEEERGPRDDVNWAELPEELFLKPEQIRAILETWEPSPRKAELLAELDELEKKKQKQK